MDSSITEPKSLDWVYPKDPILEQVVAKATLPGPRPDIESLEKEIERLKTRLDKLQPVESVVREALIQQILNLQDQVNQYVPHPRLDSNVFKQRDNQGFPVVVPIAIDEYEVKFWSNTGYRVIRGIPENADGLHRAYADVMHQLSGRYTRRTKDIGLQPWVVVTTGIAGSIGLSGGYVLLMLIASLVFQIQLVAITNWLLMVGAIAGMIIGLNIRWLSDRTLTVRYPAVIPDQIKEFVRKKYWTDDFNAFGILVAVTDWKINSYTISSSEALLIRYNSYTKAWYIITSFKGIPLESYIDA